MGFTTPLWVLTDLDPEMRKQIFFEKIKIEKIYIPCTWWQLLCKGIAWAVLGLVNKYGFAGMKGFPQALLNHQLPPAFQGSGLGWAFADSVFTNILFDSQMMAFHNIEDNLILGRKGFQGITKAWIPAQTITFLLPADKLIGLAALWSLVLGIIMVATKK